MKRSFFVFGCIGAFACQEYEIKQTSNGANDLSDDGEPDIVVNPYVITFPDLDASAGLEAQEIVIVTNQGEVDLLVDDIFVDDAAGPFSIGAITTPLIPPGQQAQFAVTFAPETAANNRGFVYIESNDPDTPSAEVELLGVGIAPIIDVTPSEYDFGTLYIGCDTSQTLTISNLGTANLEVSNFSFSTASNDLSFDDLGAVNGPLPWNIAPNQSVEVFVDYAPLDEIADAAFLTITSNDPYTPDVLATQDGLGDLFGTNVDLFEQPLEGATDIIFAVDRSCSMDENVEDMMANFADFTNTLGTMNSDYHVAAVVVDSGCIYGPDTWIDSTFSATQANSALETMIDINLQNTPYGSNTERAFMLMEAMLSESVDGNGAPYPGGCNYNLIREEAKLALVGVSDEPEQSVNSYSYYISLFQSLKSNPSDVVIHGIGGDYPSGCGSNSAYTGMYEATVATGGLFLSICATDWSTHLTALAEGSAQDLSSFELTQWPVPETIVVKVDGQTQTIGWEYNPTDNAIDFDQDYVPEGGSQVQVDYALYGDCSQ